MQNIKLDPKIINHWIMDHLKNVKCKICNGTDYEISPKPFELREFFGGVLKVGTGGALILVPMICQTCKHVEFFSSTAIVIQNKINNEQAIEVGDKNESDIMIK